MPPTTPDPASATPVAAGPDYSPGDDRPIHVSPVRVVGPAALVAHAATLLDPAERAHAARFHADQDRARYVLAHAALRVLLARRVGVAPAEVRFRTGPNGKPALAAPDAALRFNLAHAGDVAVVAVADGCEVGVDVEPVRPLPEWRAIARRYFAPDEVRTLAALDESRRAAAFFRCWTCKEAYLKARGDGLALPLDAFSVAADPDALPALLRAAPPDDAAAWAIHTFEPLPPYAGAVAWPERRRPIRVEPTVDLAALLGGA